MQIVGISGSPRRGGNSDLILGCILEGARNVGATTESVFLSDLSFSSCVGCEQCRKNKACTRFEDDLTPLYPRIFEARGMVLVSPSAPTRTSVSQRGRPRGWSSRLAGKGRMAVLAIVAEQTSDKDLGVTMEALRLPMEALGYRIVGESPVLGMFEAGVVKDFPEVLNRAAELGKVLALALNT